MLRLARFSLKTKNVPSGRVDTSSLTATQLEEIREAVTQSAGDKQDSDGNYQVTSAGAGKFVIHKKSGHVHKRSQKEIKPWYWVRDGTPALYKAKNPKIDFIEQDYPNYPGDPLPTKMLGWRKEFQKPKMQFKSYKKETAMQFAPFRRTIINIAQNSQGILPKQLIESAKSEFIAVNKGYGKRKEESYIVNNFSSFKYANPRASKHDMCVIGGQPLGNVQRYRMHRQFFRTFADGNKISGVTTMKFGPRVPLHNCFRPDLSQKYRFRSYQWSDDLPVYE